MGVKTCSKCRETQSLEEFSASKDCRDGRRGTCKSCARAYSRKWYVSSQRANHLRRKYGLALHEYEAMLSAQGGGCAICAKTPEENGRALAVDHDHTCCPGKETCGACVRGLLCGTCNQGIGLLADSAERLLSAAKYLGAHV